MDKPNEPQPDIYDGYDLAPDDEQGQVELPSGISLSWFPKQQEWLQAVESGLYSFMAFGGAIRGGKTWTVLMTVLLLMREYPRSRHIVVRKDLPLIRKHIVPHIDKLRDLTGGFLGPLNQTKWSVKAVNGSEMLFIPESLKDDPKLEDFRGAEANTFTLEEANELSAQMNYKAIERAGTYVIPPDRNQIIAISRAVQRGMPHSEAFKHFGPRQCPPYVFYTMNPADNWVRDEIYDPWERGELKAPFFFMPSTIYDNPYNSPKFIKNVESLKDRDPDAYDQFVLGKWGAIRVENQLIDPTWIRTAREEVPYVPGVNRLGGDIARMGKDSTIWVVVEGNTISAINEFRRIDIVNAATQGTVLANKYGVAGQYINVDTNGLGGGVADIMRSNGIRVNDFIVGAKPIVRVLGHQPRGAFLSPIRSFYKFGDLWSQAAWEAREKFRKGEVRLVAKHPNLIKHLTSFRYDVTNREIKVWSSNTVREELFFSPDVGVAIILALFDFPRKATGYYLPSASSGSAAGGGTPRAARRYL
jgi:hypothetical protein